MISRNRSISTAAAMSIERTTSANSTVTCLYSAASTDTSCDPHASQNLAPSWGVAPHDRHTAGAAVTASSAADPAVRTDCPIRPGYGFTGLNRGDFHAQGTRGMRRHGDGLPAAAVTARAIAHRANRIRESRLLA